MKPQSAGGKVMAVRQRLAAEARYLANPNICKYCNNVVPIEPGRKMAEVRAKQFCNHSCAARYFAARRPKREKVPKAKTTRLLAVAGKTKGTLFKDSKSWQAARSQIRRHAANVYWKHHDKILCEQPGCLFSSHVEVCHKRSVSSFDDSTTISEINSLENLIGLCPNHHWEFDHKG